MLPGPNPCDTAWASYNPGCALYPDIPVPPEVGVEHPHELLDRDPGPVAAVEELYLQPPEEALAPRVVGTASLPRHRPD